MHKYKIAEKFEKFAPLETQEDWDCSGWEVNNKEYDDIRKVMLCLTVTDDIISQAKEQNCDMIISHHPCFYTPINWSNINIYSAHTNFDKANGGTTDTIIEKLGLSDYKIEIKHEFLRIIEKDFSIDEFSKIIKGISPNARVVNTHKIERLKKIAFCAGSGSEFIADAKEFGADCLVTGDLKFHTALDSPIVLYDIGHFESEILILPVFEKLIGNEVTIVYAKEQNPFKNIK
ncbi:Nif3-like dinuclear metal center hexameric protein [bacterium]|nr:Nif3-like dinuclear metal center hexameric protein [bacterium]